MDDVSTQKPGALRRLSRAFQTFLRGIKKQLPQELAGVPPDEVQQLKRDEHRVSSIIREGDTFHGISVVGRGVFTNDEFDGRTYAGQHRDGYTCGLGVVTLFDGSKVYAEYGPDGKYDGRNLDRYASGNTYYRLFERGERKGWAAVSADGRCTYNGEVCARDDPRVLALIAQVAPVEVRPAAGAPSPSIGPLSPPSNRPMDQPARFAPSGAGDRRGHRGAPPTLHAVAGGHGTQPNNSRTAKHGHAVTRARTVLP
jgi:hypothetical protein